MAEQLLLVLVFPGLVFLSVLGLAAEFMDRKLYARFQNRIGPPWFQPVADFIKLVGKEVVMPDEAHPFLFRMAPVVAVASAVAAIFPMPLWQHRALVSFPGDLIVVLYLLTLPTLMFFVGGWSSCSLFAKIGSVRAVTQLFAFEIPLYLTTLTAAILAGSWSLSDMAAFYGARPGLLAVNLPGFLVALVTLMGKLERVPFDIPEAETEIVAGAFTEYSGRWLAMFHLAIDIEMVVGAALLAAVFFPVGLGTGAVAGFAMFLVKVFFIVFLLSVARSIVARLRLDQMIAFCWKVMVPVAGLQLLINLAVKGLFVR